MRAMTCHDIHDVKAEGVPTVMHEAPDTISYASATLRRMLVCLGLCSVFLLQGCFEGSNDAPNKDGDKSKASLQIQKDKVPEQSK
ncbi:MULTISPECIES: hypothetical protein [Pseudomonas]|uniref:hypothetical protein n=1 Tax=Pseudomonas TaxID=286 RepID=UPI0008765108|nr:MULTISPECIES: hypothetical protein [Pseudomonas]TFA85538.1 hypothetical protein F638_1812 [Pseudomonas sp. LAIL14HWK12:I2]SCZ40476.1 hypothetical protein SAMN03159313_5285 [Pseudomonas sp. NFIX46]SDB52994.1 hypothetical protein SAMN03097715_04074 [Pseudomonas putida]SFQ92545.1 hypothetical protein SAMN03159312_4911 [Pseudomonas sp. NFIX49]